MPGLILDLTVQRASTLLWKAGSNLVAGQRHVNVFPTGIPFLVSRDTQSKQSSVFA